MKRLLDVGVSMLSLVALAPIFALIAAAIMIDSGWPVFYSQIRVGKNFRLFRIRKFRSMGANAGGPLITIGGDRRVTRIGRLLRAAKLDELPQLWNVLTGDMSLVGPRPEVPEYVGRFREEFAPVLTVRPGLTDVSTLCFHDEEMVLAAASDPLLAYTTRILPEKLRLAKIYVRERSMLKDIVILIATAGLLAGIQPAWGVAKYLNPRTGE